MINIWPNISEMMQTCSINMESWCNLSTYTSHAGNVSKLMNLSMMMRFSPIVG